MRRFKLHEGLSPSYEITRKNFEEKTQNRDPFTQLGKDRKKRNFALCPACDNPIQLIGLYKDLQNTNHPYGKHYNRDVPKLAMHNERRYQYCPYASHTYEVNKDSRKAEITDFELDIYNTTREYFDLAVYIIEKETGLKITQKMAKRILNEYVASDGHMYYFATLYNIPWMLLYFLRSTPMYGQIVHKKSHLYEYLTTRKDVKLEDSQVYKDYCCVNRNKRYLNLGFAFILHECGRTDDDDDETIQFTLSSDKENGLFQIQKKIILEINNNRFPALIKKAKNRNEYLLNMAKELMPVLRLAEQ